jgi:hypothetical protein
VKLKGLLKRLWYAFFPPAKLEILDSMSGWLEGLTPQKIQGIYQQFFNSTAGKIIIADLEAKYGNRSTVTESKDEAIDPFGMAVREGERRVLLRIKNLSKKE